MRSFNELVFDQIVRGNVEVFSTAEWNDLLGRGDELVYEVEVEDFAGTNVTLTVRHLHCNGQKGFIGLAAFINNTSLTGGPLPFRKVEVVGGPLAGYGQVGVKLSDANAWARVRIWACGRTK